MNKIGMIGVGNMGTALAKAILKADYTMVLHGHDNNKIKKLLTNVNVIEANSLDLLINNTDLIYIGVKPKQFASLFSQLQNLIDKDKPKIWVSMAAGLPLEELVKFCPKSHSWIRIMPNLAVEIGAGYIAYCNSMNTSDDKITLFQNSLKKAGIVEQIPENLFDAVTGIAGSSPAFIYQLIEAMSDVGVAYGLSRLQSRNMASQAIKGAASMVLESGKHPLELKDEVTSPGGTTIAGIVALEHAGFKSAIHKGLSASINKSIEIKNYITNK